MKYTINTIFKGEKLKNFYKCNFKFKIYLCTFHSKINILYHDIWLDF